MFVPSLFPVIYMSSTNVKGETFYVYVVLHLHRTEHNRSKLGSASPTSNLR